jgi:acyl carrier protein
MALSEEEIRQKVLAIIDEQLGLNEEQKANINDNTRFKEDLKADSLDSVEIVMEFEDEFEINIPEEELEKLQTFGQAVEFIKNAPPAPPVPPPPATGC